MALRNDVALVSPEGVLVTPPNGPPPAPLGGRGERPVFLPTNIGGEWLHGILEIPGVQKVPGGLRCTWDVAWALARLLHVPEPPVPSHEGPLPGLPRYRALGLHTQTKPHQKSAILFLARRSWAILADPMRGGKTLSALAASVVVDARKTLIICPEYARPGWADEVQLWTGEAALLLCGRGAREARLRCLTCRGRSEIQDAPCPDCKARNGQSIGSTLFDVSELTPLRTYAGEAIRWDAIGKLACPKHPNVHAQTAVKGDRRFFCGQCQAELHAAIEQARFVIVNYELLTRQHVDMGGGVMGARTDLAGWVDTLKQFHFDVCIADEAQALRNWTASPKRKGEARNERVFDLVGERRIPRVWMVTGTPFYGFVRDVYWLLEIASGGLWGGSTPLRGKGFMKRYCDGHKGSFGFEAKGRSVYAETELMRRLVGHSPGSGSSEAFVQGGPREGVMIQRTRAELFADTPPVERQVVYLDLETKPFLPGRSRRGTDAIGKAIVALNDLKREALLDRFLDEMAEGNKIIIFTFHVVSAKKTFLALEKEMNTPARRTRMREVNARMWLATGPKRKRSDALDLDLDNDNAEGDGDGEDELSIVQRGQWASAGDARYRMAEAYREHTGAAGLVATIDSMPGALSLRGASSVNFLDLHWSPGAMAQAEARPWYPGVIDLTTLYFVARGSVDDHIAAEVLPKVETLARLAKEEGAEAMLGSFTKDDETRTIEAIYNRLTKHLRPLDAHPGTGG